MDTAKSKAKTGRSLRERYPGLLAGVKSPRFWTAFAGFGLSLIVVFSLLLYTSHIELRGLLSPLAESGQPLGPEKVDSILAQELERKVWLAVAVFVWLMGIFTLFWACWHRFVERTVRGVQDERDEAAHALQDSRKAQELANRQAEELRQINRSKDSFISILAHDLKNPFHSLLGLSEMLAEDAETLEKAQVREYALHIHRSGERLYRLLQNLLDWSRLERGTMAFNPVEQAFSETVEETVFLYADMARSKAIGLTVDAPRELQVYADGNMLKAILRNLTSNALKFTPEGGSVTVSARKQPGGVELTVSDTGIGMDEAKRKQLLSVERPGPDRAGTFGEESTGLGLLLCRQMIARHQGKLEVASVPGEGSTFTAFFPGKKRRRRLTRAGMGAFGGAVG